ncbi:MAG: LysM peptidoglycan-binding domain-containing protein [Planctomycetota bacterium]|nr:LysM peptidoglycan-binding domain-containing protein [Planctomycetota bacterium]
MRSDIKVGMAIAVILIGIGVVWILFFRSGPPDEKPPGTEETEVTGRTDDTNIVVVPPPADSQQDQSPVLSPTEHLVRPTYRDEESDATTRPAGVAGTPAVAAVRPAGTPGEWDDVPDRPESTTYVPGTTEGSAATGGLASVTERTYVVKEGDSYWTIAQNLWGDGSLHTHLQKANPKISIEDLRPRMTIKVPPKPVRSSSASVSAAVAAARSGTTGIDLLTGKRYYIVKKGDRGFWDISKAVYGEGKHWKLIESANPKLNSRKLRPGQKVWCPDKPPGTTGAAAGSARTETVHAESATTAPVTSASGGAGAPARTILPDGRIFD